MPPCAAGVFVMLDEDLLRAVFAIVDRHHLTDVETAALSGTSVPTVRIMRRGRMLPAHEGPRQRVARFVEINRNAKTRSDLRLLEAR